MRTSRSNQDNLDMIIGHPLVTAKLSTGSARHAGENEGFSAWRPDLETESYPGRGYEFSGVGDFAQAPSTDPITSILNFFSPTVLGLAVVIGAAYFFLRKERYHG